MDNYARDFEEFWKQYPRHVGKLAAQKAYRHARTLASAAEILAGIEVYKRNKPAYADWAHAATWLRAGRWMDDYDTKPIIVPQPRKDTRAAYQPYVPMRLRKFED
jgi:hypothetical protein